MKMGKGRVINKRSQTGKKFYDRYFVYIPSYVAKDERFPFQAGQEVLVTIEGEKLIIEKSP